MKQVQTIKGPNIKGLVEALASENESLRQYFIKHGKFPERDRLWFISTEETFYKMFGIRIEIHSFDDFARLEEHYRKQLDKCKV